MDKVITNLDAGRFIEAIKEFRVAYGVGLKEAKDAVEALRAAYVPHTVPYSRTQHLVLSRFEHDYDWNVTHCDDKHEATSFADGIVNDRDETIVCKVVRRSVTVTTRTMKDI